MSAVLAGIAVVMMTSCAELPEPDASGMTRDEALGMPLEEQYALAGERYRELNDRVAVLQRELFDGEWLEKSSTEVTPLQGYVRAPELPGDDRGESYYFWVARNYPTRQDLAPVLQDAAESWKARGWKVVKEVSDIDGSVWVTAKTEDGYFYELMEHPGELTISGSSPVYWGDYSPLLFAIADRRAVDPVFIAWRESRVPVDEDGRAYALPGAYPPFPSWDAIDEEP